MNSVEKVLDEIIAEQAAKLAALKERNATLPPG